MSRRASLIAIGVFCFVANGHAQEFSDEPLPSARRQAFIRGHSDCIKTYTQKLESANAPPGDVADAALESCASWMDDLKKEIPSYEDRDTTVAKIESRARRVSIKQVLEARLAGKK